MNKSLCLTRRYAETPYHEVEVFVSTVVHSNPDERTHGTH